MTSKLAKFLVALLLLGGSGLTSAEVRPIDIFTVDGVAGTGGYSTYVGPCYCTQNAYYSPVMLLQPGTYDFGELTDYWVQSGAAPDGGPDQPNLYLLFSPIEITSTYPDDYPWTYFTFPDTSTCAQDDAACNASFQGKSTDMDLVVTLPPGQNAVQIVLIGQYLYTSPLPEPLASAMFVLGLALVAGIARKRCLPA